jgi:hypothetical protein
MTTALTFLLFMWISKRFLFAGFLNISFLIFPHICYSTHFRFFYLCLSLCARFTRFYYFLFMNVCRVVWWLCGVGFSFCGFHVSLIFTYAIIVGINADLRVWFCQNLMWKIFCLFFLRVVKWVVWHFSICFQQTFSRRTRFCAIRGVAEK